MKTKLLTTAVLAFGVSFGAQASLISSGPLTVYDSAQTLTWTKDANLNGQMDWTTAVAWANNLDYAGYTDWVLPNIDQLTTQFSTNLGEAAGSSIADSHNDSYNLFTNVQSYAYWSGSESAPNSALAWDYNTLLGLQQINTVAYGFYAWAVRPGDIAASSVPVPAAVWLFGSGLIGLASFSRRKNKSANLIAA
jgi:hypothetical protein